MPRKRHLPTFGAAVLSAAAIITISSPALPAAGRPARSGRPFLAGLGKISTLASTVPPNGDVNPYGLVVVGSSAGRLHAGSFLVSNFNDRANRQGTGTTIVEIGPNGHRSTFARLRARSLPGRCPGGVGLTTALTVLPRDFVIVGSLPTTNGMSATARAGCLIVLNDVGQPVRTIAGRLIQGPWDLTEAVSGSRATLFVSMVLDGGAARGRHTIDNSTVVRIGLRIPVAGAPRVTGERVIADRIPRRDDPSALVIGPTGLALSANGTLYLADTLANRLTAIAHPLTRRVPAHGGGTTVTRGGLLRQPLGLAVAPNGDLLSANAGDGNIVETSPTGVQRLSLTADSHTGAGSLFGLALAPAGHGLLYVDDGDNTLRLLHR